jgi:hypothetical protein
MNILQTITTQRAKLDAKVNAAIAERDAFIESISELLGASGRKSRKAKNRKLSLAAKRRWKEKKKAGKNSL